MKHQRFRQKIVFVKYKKNRQIITKGEGSKEEDRQEEADVKQFLVKNGYTDLKRRHQNAKIRKIWKWADRGKHWTSKQRRSANSTRSLLFVQPTLLVTITRLLFCLWTDPLWSWCYSLEKFNCRGWCVVLSAAHKVFGWSKFPQPSE